MDPLIESGSAVSSYIRSFDIVDKRLDEAEITDKFAASEARKQKIQPNVVPFKPRTNEGYIDTKIYLIYACY